MWSVRAEDFLFVFNSVFCHGGAATSVRFRTTQEAPDGNHWLPMVRHSFTSDVQVSCCGRAPVCRARQLHAAGQLFENVREEGEVTEPVVVLAEPHAQPATCNKPHVFRSVP